MENTQIRILLAEDESSLRNMVALVLSDEGYQVDDVADGNEAFNLMQQHKYDLLVTDLYMPVMNGFELILACKESFPETKIILLSGGGRDFEAEQGKGLIKFKDQQIIIENFLKKPCKLNDLLSVIDEQFQDK